MNHNFNTDPGLFVNLRKAGEQSVLPAHLKIIEGHIYQGNDVVARFNTNEGAITCLELAGYKLLSEDDEGLNYVSKHNATQIPVYIKKEKA